MSGARAADLTFSFELKNPQINYLAMSDLSTRSCSTAINLGVYAIALVESVLFLSGSYVFALLYKILLSGYRCE